MTGKHAFAALALALCFCASAQAAELDKLLVPAKPKGTEALQRLVEDLSQRWYPSCNLEEASSISVSFRVVSPGVVGGPVETSVDASPDLRVRLAADRLKMLVRGAETLKDLPPELYGEKITVRFNADKACAD